tara:strand:- start:1735 stop:2304 length:570 start_codon:yes stop_codon:yes gene_type:complete
MNFSNTLNHYDTTLRGLNTAGLDGTYPEGGAVRGGCGRLYEEITTMIINEVSPNLIVKQRDNLIAEAGGYVNDGIQVDLHVYDKDEAKFVVECKSYLDSSMLKRAIMDFYEVKKVLGDCPRIISTGQLSIKEATLNYHRELAKEFEVPFEVFVLNSNKFRRKGQSVATTLDPLDKNALDLLGNHIRNIS